MGNASSKRNKQGEAKSVTQQSLHVQIDRQSSAGTCTYFKFVVNGGLTKYVIICISPYATEDMDATSRTRTTLRDDTGSPGTWSYVDPCYNYLMYMCDQAFVFSSKSITDGHPSLIRDKSNFDILSQNLTGMFKCIICVLRFLKLIKSFSWKHTGNHKGTKEPHLGNFLETHPHPEVHVSEVDHLDAISGGMATPQLKIQLVYV